MQSGRFSQSPAFLSRTAKEGDEKYPPPPQSHTVCIDCTFSLGRGEGGGGQREGRRAAVHKYCSFVHGGNRGGGHEREISNAGR
jgi:hypothetical protein